MPVCSWAHWKRAFIASLELCRPAMIPRRWRLSSGNFTLPDYNRFEYHRNTNCGREQKGRECVFTITLALVWKLTRLGEIPGGLPRSRLEPPCHALRATPWRACFNTRIRLPLRTLAHVLSILQTQFSDQQREIPQRTHPMGLNYHLWFFFRAEWQTIIQGSKKSWEVW